MPPLKDLTGQRFGRFVVIERGEDKLRSNGLVRPRWLCRCDCGAVRLVLGDSLRSGKSKSCGCLKDDVAKLTHTTHNLSNHPLYKIWYDMKRRCTNVNTSRYCDYGGRGIQVCSSWDTDFLSFYEWSYANGYKPGLQIDRIDNDGNYCPENCRWSTQMEQANNTRKNVRWTYNGKTQTIAQWASELGMNPITLRDRVNRYGWSIERALTEVVRK